MGKSLQPENIIIEGDALAVIECILNGQQVGDWRGSSFVQSCHNIILEVFTLFGSSILYQGVLTKVAHNLVAWTVKSPYCGGYLTPDIFSSFKLVSSQSESSVDVDSAVWTDINEIG